MISLAYNTSILSVTNELDHADREELYKSVVILVYRAITFPDINRLISIVVNKKYDYSSDGFYNNVHG